MVACCMRESLLPFIKQLRRQWKREGRKGWDQEAGRLLSLDALCIMPAVLFFWALSPPSPLYQTQNKGKTWQWWRHGVKNRQTNNKNNDDYLDLKIWKFELKIYLFINYIIYYENFWWYYCNKWKWYLFDGNCIYAYWQFRLGLVSERNFEMDRTLFACMTLCFRQWWWNIFIRHFVLVLQQQPRFPRTLHGQLWTSPEFFPPNLR